MRAVVARSTRYIDGPGAPASLYFTSGSAWVEEPPDSGQFRMVQVCMSCVCPATDVYPVLYEPQGRGGGDRLSRLVPRGVSVRRASLQRDRREHVVIIASEPLSSLSEDWLEVPRNYLLRVRWCM